VYVERSLEESHRQRKLTIKERAPAAGFDTRQWIQLRFERGTRYYALILMQSLWGEWCLRRINGRSSSALGLERTAWAGELEEGLLVLAAAVKRRRQRGYRLM
jgi:hypothetical protein